jgi:hypothetical protein
MSKRRLSSGGTGGLESNKIPRSSAIQSDSMLQSLDESWAGSAKVCLEPFLGTPTSIALARFLDDVKNSIFKSLRASKDFSEVHVPLGDVEPLDRELAMEVDSLEKEVERLAKQVKDARESVRLTNHSPSIFVYMHPLCDLLFFLSPHTLDDFLGPRNTTPGYSQSPKLSLKNAYSGYEHSR